MELHVAAMGVLTSSCDGTDGERERDRKRESRRGGRWRERQGHVTGGVMMLAGGGGAGQRCSDDGWRRELQALADVLFERGGRAPAEEQGGRGERENQREKEREGEKEGRRRAGALRHLVAGGRWGAWTRTARGGAEEGAGGCLDPIWIERWVREAAGCGGESGRIPRKEETRWRFFCGGGEEMMDGRDRARVSSVYIARGFWLGANRTLRLRTDGRDK